MTEYNVVFVLNVSNHQLCKVRQSLAFKSMATSHAPRSSKANSNRNGRTRMSRGPLSTVSLNSAQPPARGLTLAHSKLNENGLNAQDAGTCTDRTNTITPHPLEELSTAPADHERYTKRNHFNVSHTATFCSGTTF